MGWKSLDLHAASQALGRVTAWEVALGIGVFLISLAGSAAAAAFVLCRLPADYLLRDPDAASADSGPRARRLLLAVGKNLLGALLVVLGVVLSLPGVPGQGLLTILVGVMLLDVPGKQKLERRIMSRPTVYRAVNGLRARFGRPPLLPSETVTKAAFSAAHPATR